jgi:site-specific DNA-methyltransferase (adenine-specific)
MKLIPISKLKVNKLNEQLYGLNEDLSDLEHSITSPKDIKPIIVNPSYTIISGHRRYLTAKKKGFKQVPIEIRKFKTINEENDFLIRENITRETNNYQKIKIAVELKRLIDGGMTQVTRVKGDKNFIARIVKLGTYQSFHRSETVLNQINLLLKNKKYKEANYLIDLLNENILSAYYLVKDNVLAKQNINKYATEVDKEKKKNPKGKIVLANISRNSKKLVELDNYEKAASNKDFKNKEYRLNKFWYGDAVDVLKSFPDNSIDCTITDPPYAINYKHPTQKNYKDTPIHVFKVIDLVCKELRRVTKESSHLYFCFASSQYDEVYKILIKYFGVSPIPLIWDKTTKTKSVKSDLDYFNPIDYECIFFCWNNKNKDAKRRKFNEPFNSSILKISSVGAGSSKIHSGQKPVELIDELVKRSSVPGEIVLDPFAGSGSTCLSALLNDRWFIGIENDPHIWKRSYFNRWQNSIQCVWNKDKNKMMPYIKEKEYWFNNLLENELFKRKDFISLMKKYVDITSKNAIQKKMYNSELVKLSKKYNDDKLLREENSIKNKLDKILLTLPPFEKAVLKD